MPRVPRPSRQQFDCRIRYVVSGEDAVFERFASNFSEGGLFIREDRPSPVGSLILVEFILPDGQPLCRTAARVVHARPSTIADDQTAGMGVEFVELDAVAKSIVEKLECQRPRAVAPELDETQEPRLLDLAGLEAPLITSSGPIVGIDLGTVNSCVATVKGGRPHVILSPQGYDTVPSVVFLSTKGEVHVGHKALERMILEPDRAVYGAKRFLGRPFVSKEVQTYGHFFTYDIVPDEAGRSAAAVGGAQMALEAVSGTILSLLRTMAEQNLGCAISRAVVTVPAYFGATQRQAVRDAGRLAGLNVERILNEPTAAAIAYGYGRGMDKVVLVYDLGGGTFDATVLRIKNDTFEVLATDGDPFLGGSDFDDRLTEYVLTAFERQEDATLRRDAVAVQRVRFAVELAKRQLTEASKADLDLPYIMQKPGGPVHLRMTLSRNLMERLTQDLVDRTMLIVQEVLDRADLNARQLDDVILVGGQSRSPIVRKRLLARFGKRPTAAVHPTEAVAMGAALVAEALHSDLAIHMADILPATIHVARADGTTQALLHRGARLPAHHEFEVSLSSDTQTGTRISLYRGEHPTVADNAFLGSLAFPPVAISGDVPLAARVKLEVSGDGILSVSMRHPMTGDLRSLELLLRSD